MTFIYHSAVLTYVLLKTFSTDWNWSLFREFLPFQNMTHQFKELSKYNFQETWMSMICQRIKCCCFSLWFKVKIVSETQRVNASFFLFKESACKIFFFVQFSHNARIHNEIAIIISMFESYIARISSRCCLHFANVDAQTKATNKTNWIVNYFAFFVDFAFYLCVWACDCACVYKLCLFMHWNHMSVGKRYICFYSMVRVLLFCCCQFLCVVDLISG